MGVIWGRSIKGLDESEVPAHVLNIGLQMESCREMAIAAACCA